MNLVRRSEWIRILLLLSFGACIAWKDTAHPLRLGDATIQVPVAQGETVGELKGKIADIKGFDKDKLLDPKVGMKLIHAGSILADNFVVDEIAKSKSFLVLMPPKGASKQTAPKQQQQQQQQTPLTSHAPTDAAPAASSPPRSAAAASSSSTLPPPPPPPPAAAAAVASSTTSASASSDGAPSSSVMTQDTAPPAVSPSTQGGAGAEANVLVSGEQLEASIQEMVAMGFSEAEARRAMRAAFNNPSRAVDILFSGIPDSSQRDTGAAGAVESEGASAEGDEMNEDQGTASSSALSQTATLPSATNASSSPLDFLQRMPHFVLMRQSVQLQPSLLPQLLQQLGRSDPQLLALINANQAEFVRLINQPVTQEEFNAAVQQVQSGEYGALGGGRPPAREGHQIQVTQAEMAQIQRLEEIAIPLGLDRQAVLEAWLACDKDEELAANYLLNNLDDIRGDPAGRG